MGITVSPDTGTTFESGAAEYIVVKALDANTFVVAYRDGNDSNKGKAVIGTRVGTTITISLSDITTFSTNETAYIDVVVLSPSLIVISYQDVTSGIGELIAATISGTSLTFGSAVTFTDVNNPNSTSVCKVDSTSFVSSYAYGTEVVSEVGTISGTTITLGADYSVNSGTTSDYVASDNLNSTDVIITYRSGAGVSARVAIVNTGAYTLTLGTALSLDSGFTPKGVKVASFDELHIIVLYVDATDQGWVIAGSINDITHTITAGTKAGFAPAAGSYYSLCTMDSTHFLASYKYTWDGTGLVNSGYLTGAATLTIESPWQVVFDTHSITYTGICNLDGSYFMIGFKHP